MGFFHALRHVLGASDRGPRVKIDDSLIELSRKFSSPPPASLVPDVDLDQYLRQLIAAHDGTTPDRVDIQYRRERRIRDFYPTARYIDGAGAQGSSYGGYDATGLLYLTLEEHEKLSAELDRRLANF